MPVPDIRPIISLDRFGMNKIFSIQQNGRQFGRHLVLTIQKPDTNPVLEWLGLA
jgi:hypothetical protein